MNQGLRCSVVIPTFNSLDLLILAITSVRMQAIEDIEILIIDDASTDGTWDWLVSEAKRDHRVKPLRGAGKGPGSARNLAISKASAPFIAFLDADDLWWPGKLKRALEFHEANPEVGFSFTDYLHIDPRGNVRGTCFNFWRPAYVDWNDFQFRTIQNAELELLAANTAGTSTVVASRNALQNAHGFGEDWRSASDWDLWLRLAALAPVAFSAATTTTYLMCPTSVTQNRRARIDAMRKVVNLYAARTDPQFRRACRKAKSRIAIAEAEHYRELGEHWAAAFAHLDAFVKHPRCRTARAALADLFETCHMKLRR